MRHDPAIAAGVLNTTVIRKRGETQPSHVNRTSAATEQYSIASATDAAFGRRRSEPDS